MEWWHQLHRETRQEMARTGLPRKVLRHLVVAHGVGVGSRVLDVGCGGGELVGFLQDLGLFATGCEESAVKLTRARRNNPKLDLVHCQAFERGVPFAAHQFDLILVRNLSVYHGNLLAADALKTTAHLAACVRPGGYLVFLTSMAEEPADAGPAHDGSCFLRHVSLFRGSAETAEFPDRFPLRRLQLVKSPAPAGHRLTGLRVPRWPLPRADWGRQAENAVRVPAEACCSRVVPGHRCAPPRRVA